MSLKDELKPNVSALLQQVALSEGLLVTKIQDLAAFTELISRGLVVIKGAHVYVDWIHVPKS